MKPTKGLYTTREFAALLTEKGRPTSQLQVQAMIRTGLIQIADRVAGVALISREYLGIALKRPGRGRPAGTGDTYRRKRGAHGSQQAYQYRGCRCDDCLKAHNDHLRAVSSKQRIAKHGTRSMYVAGCRCEPCQIANRIYRNSQINKNK